MAHAVVRIVLPDSIPGFAGTLSRKGFPMSVLTVWPITLFEIGSGGLMILVNAAVGWSV